MSQSPQIIDGYDHQIGSHCESGTFRNLLTNTGFEISEPMAFGIGTGIAFYYVFFARGPSGLPLVALRKAPGAIFKTASKRLHVDLQKRQYKHVDQAIEHATRLIGEGIPVAATVDMFYMKYLPSFIQVHAPFHFILLVGRDGDRFAVSDPYFGGIGTLHIEDLKAAWETHAPMAKDNRLFYLNGSVPSLERLKPAVKQGIKDTCGTMTIPPLINKMVPFVGIEGIRTFAKKMRAWPDTYRGVQLREGILFTAVTFEEQGTGGGAFRLLYGSFLQEVAELFGSQEMADLAGRIIEHGNNWKEMSRALIRVGKTLPMNNEAYADWFAENGTALKDGLGEISDTFGKFADVEAVFFKDLKAAAGRLP